MLKRVAVLIVLFAIFVSTAVCQSATRSVQAISALTPQSTSASEQQLQREQAGRLFIERQRQLRIDTAKLLELTTELKQQVDKTNVNILSLDVVKKAQEIQKLAKSVQEKMKYGY